MYNIIYTIILNLKHNNNNNNNIVKFIVKMYMIYL